MQVKNNLFHFYSDKNGQKRTLRLSDVLSLQCDFETTHKNIIHQTSNIINQKAYATQLQYRHVAEPS